MDSVFVMARCSDFDEWHKARSNPADRTTYAFLDLTEAEVYANNLQNSQYLYDRGDAETDWVFRVPLSEIEDAPCCAECGKYRLDLETEWVLGDSREVCPNGCSRRSQREEARLELHLVEVR